MGSKGNTLSTVIFMFSGLISILLTDPVESRIRKCSSHCSRCDAGHCMECYYGYWGHNCQHECINCWLTGCNKHSGRCEQCSPGRYGRHCNSACSDKCRPSKFEDVAHCHRHTGRCLDGCVAGWWGPDCQHECSGGCKQAACYQEDGACISDCKHGYYGRHCNMSCSEGCSLGTCDWRKGTCHGGCKCGYAGDTCEDVCSKNCKTVCKQDAASNCLKCPQCKHGFFGQNCDFECSNCTSKSCDMSGYCTESCKEGYYGGTCNNKCSPDCRACNRSSGECSSRDDESSTVQRPSTGYIFSFTEEYIPTDAADHTIERSGIIQRLILPILALHVMQS